jgi:FdrA protein
MSFTVYEIRSGAYYDSVVLMQLQRALIDLPGVLDAGVVMATTANLELLSQSQLLPEDLGSASPEDLLIVVQGESEEKALEGLGQVDRLLTERRSADEIGFNPRSLEAAVKMQPDSKWVLISVPGRYAARVTQDALKLGLHVFLYSDNVTLEDEINLKERAAEKGLFVMGPDCGTAIIQGIGLGFANRVRTGPIGLIGASGTGLQAITSRIHNLGGGISHAIGTGGRDLKHEVGGITASQALEVLGRDPDTKVIVLVSKPPDPEVASRLLKQAQEIGKPVVVQFMGFAAPAQQMENIHFARNFDEAADQALQLSQGEKEIGERDVRENLPGEGRRFIRGLFSGGSLANEALRVLQLTTYPLFSNIPLTESQRLSDSLRSQANTILDLGEDEFTVGRLHPMMDNTLRLRRIRQEALDPEVAVILLDIVLGEGAHIDPAGELAPMIAEMREESPVEFVAVLVGTEDDPQGLESQQKRLEEVGVRVFHSVIEAVRYITTRIKFATETKPPPVSLEDLIGPLSVINVGLEGFYTSLIDQGASAVHVEWRPPAGGDEKLQSILEKMRS